MHVHLMYEYSPEARDYLRDRVDAVIKLTWGENIDPPGDYHILIGGRPGRELLADQKNLRTLIIPWTGLPPETGALLAEFPHISVHNIHHNTVPVAEMAITLMLTAAKQVIPVDAALRQGDWRMRYQDPPPALLLSGKTALILGYGAIGRHAARICRAMGMKVLATKRQLPSGIEDPFAHEIYPPEKLHELLPLAQALIIALPLTPSTENLIGAPELELMPENCVLVNVGRALIVNQEALYLALKNGDIGAVGLDVWYNYPENIEERSHTMPADFPFWELNNIVMSPHRAGHIAERYIMTMDQLAVLLNAAAQNEQIPNKVALSAGY